MAQAPIFQHCHALGNECYGLADKVCGQCQCNKKMCQVIMVEGESDPLLTKVLSADTLLVEPVAPAHHCVCLTVALIKPQTQYKWNTAKGKGASQPATHPCTCKVTCISSPFPEVVAVEEPTLPIAGSSQATPPLLFEEPVISGDKGIGIGGPTLGEWSLGWILG